MMETVREFACRRYWENESSWGVENFFKLLNQNIESVPSEFRNTAEITLAVGYDNDIECLITYRRPKTQEDILKEERVLGVARMRKLDQYYKLKEELGL